MGLCSGRYTNLKEPIMAEVITAFDPEVPVEHDRRGSTPWDQWFDGQIWRLTPGVDFENHPS